MTVLGNSMQRSRQTASIQGTAAAGSTDDAATPMENCSAELLELVTILTSCRDLKLATTRLVDCLCVHLDGGRVALGVCRSAGRHCRLQAISGVSQFDRQSEVVRSVESVLDEAVLRGSLHTWSALDDQQRVGTTSQKELCFLTGTNSVISSPLVDDQGKIVGAWLFLDAKPLAQLARQQGFIQTAGFCITATATQDGFRVVTVVMGHTDPERRFELAEHQLKKGLEALEFRLVATSAGDYAPVVPVENCEVESVRLALKDDLKIPITEELWPHVELVMEHPKALEAPVAAGTEVGEAVVRLGDLVLARTTLLVPEELLEARWMWRVRKRAGSVFNAED